MKNRSITFVIIGLALIFISQLLMSFGYEFLMGQSPIDFAHWALLLGALLLFSLWFCLPEHITKGIGLTIMTLGIGGIVGMCTLDFVLWAAHSTPDTKDQLLGIIFNTASIKYPFMMVGPGLFYSGICIATYGIFKNYKWQVIVVNIGALMIGLGHMIFHNHYIPVAGSLLLLIGMASILMDTNKSD